MGFADSIRANVKKRVEHLNDAPTAIAVELFTKVVDYSPTQPSAKYAKGEFINNWMIGINKVDGSVRTARSYDGIASRNAIKTIKGAGAFYRKDASITFTNNTSYAALVEYKGWPKSINPMWSGKVGPYAPVAKAWVDVALKYARGNP